METDRDHTKEPLIERRYRIQDILEPSSVVMPTMFVEGAGISLSDLTVERDLEGIVAKARDSKYVIGERSSDWVKIKNFRTIDTVILGYRTEPTFALIVGFHFPRVHNKLETVEYGSTDDENRAFLRQQSRFIRKRNERYSLLNLDYAVECNIKTGPILINCG